MTFVVGNKNIGSKTTGNWPLAEVYPEKVVFSDQVKNKSQLVKGIQASRQ
jgi:hypothetical protein